jgi:hypothetical protein
MTDICGTFEDPVIPDLGQCASLAVKRDCENPPEKSIPPCGDESFTIEHTPDLVPQFRIIATVYDTDCEPILDENDEPITGPLY